MSEEDHTGAECKRQELPETECLWYIGHSPEHTHLLKHPVIALFLLYKWHKIKELYRRNHRFFFIFVTLLTWYIFEEYQKKNSINQLDWTIALCTPPALKVRINQKSKSSKHNCWKTQQKYWNKLSYTRIHSISFESQKMDQLDLS